jgi:serine/threonine protein phosphatase PrpC
MKISGYGATDVGRSRTSNEDSILVRDDLGLFAVCDGVGGHYGGDIASQTTVAVAERFFAERAAEIETTDAESDGGHLRLVEQIRECVQQASEEIYRIATSSAGRGGMGTTATMVLIRGSKGIMAHVGDSALYLLREGRISLLSEDHSYATALVTAGLIKPEYARSHPYKGVLTRAVGLQSSVEVDTLAFDVAPGDRYLLCSDGLTRYFADDSDELRDLLAEGPDTPEATPARLVAAANERGGKDNVSAVVIQTSPEAQTVAADEAQASEVTLRFETLREIGLFHHLSMKELVHFVEVLEIERFDAGEVIVREGDLTDGLYLIVEGEVRVTRGASELAVVGAGGHFGEMSLLLDTLRSATVTALEPVRLLSMEPETFRHLVRHRPEIGAKILWAVAKVLGQRLGAADEILGEFEPTGPSPYD